MLGSNSSQKGASLLEVLVSIAILSFALIGVARLQIALVKYQTGSSTDTAAAAIFNDLADKIRANPEAAGDTRIDSSYLFIKDYSAQQEALDVPSYSCDTTVCSRDQRAVIDLYELRKRIRTDLPHGSLWITGNKSNGIEVTLMWLDKQFTEKNMLGAALQGDDGSPVLKRSNTCSTNYSESGSALLYCCPPGAVSQADSLGVRCLRQFFTP